MHAPLTRKRHQQEHRPQRPSERSDPTQHAKGRTDDCPGPHKETATRQNVTQGELARARYMPQLLLMAAVPRAYLPGALLYLSANSHSVLRQAARHGQCIAGRSVCDNRVGLALRKACSRGTAPGTRIVSHVDSSPATFHCFAPLSAAVPPSSCPYKIVPAKECGCAVLFPLAVGEGGAGLGRAGQCIHLELAPKGRPAIRAARTCAGRPQRFPIPCPRSAGAG